MRLLSRRARPAALALIAVTGLTGCMPHGGRGLQRENPLGPSFWIIPTPSEDDGLLGRVFLRPPDTALSLEEQSKPNPCLEHLAPAKTAEMPNRYEDAIDVRGSVSGGTLLALYGFSADVSGATHLVYKLRTNRKLSRLDTTAYETCCRTADCGFGYVSALIHGEGEYASASEVSAAAQGSYQVTNARGTLAMQALSRRQIQGFLAAVITAHDRTKAAQACAPGEEWLAIECVEKGAAAAMRQRCATDESQDPFWKDNAQMQSLLREQRADACRWLDEHGVAR